MHCINKRQLNELPIREWKDLILSVTVIEYSCDSIHPRPKGLKMQELGQHAFNKFCDSGLEIYKFVYKSSIYLYTLYFFSLNIKSSALRIRNIEKRFHH